MFKYPILLLYFVIVYEKQIVLKHKANKGWHKNRIKESKKLFF